jgi:6-phosphogluconate dehydrogenase
MWRTGCIIRAALLDEAFRGVARRQLAPRRAGDAFRKELLLT